MGDEREIGLAPLSLWRPDPLELIAAAGAAGFDSVGMQLCMQGTGLSPRLADPSFFSSARRELERHGLRVLEVSNIAFEEGRDPGDGQAIVEFASAIGARKVHVTNWDPDKNRALDALASVCEHAEGFGLEVAIEFMPYSETRTFADAVAMRNAIGRDNCRILLDSLHLVRSGGSVEEVRLARPEVFSFVQFADAGPVIPAPEDLRTEAVTNRLLPGEGVLPLAELLAAMPGDLPVSVEIPRAASRGMELAAAARLLLEGTRRFLAGDQAG